MQGKSHIEGIQVNERILAKSKEKRGLKFVCCKDKSTQYSLWLLPLFEQESRQLLRWNDWSNANEVFYHLKKHMEQDKNWFYVRISLC